MGIERFVQISQSDYDAICRRLRDIVNVEGASTKDLLAEEVAEILEFDVGK